MEETRKDKLQLLVRRIFLIITDIILVNGSLLLALLMRFDVRLEAIEPQYLETYKDTFLPYTIITLLIFWCFRMYHSLWQYASIAELYKIAEACVVAEILYLGLTAILGEMMPRSCYFTAGVFLLVAMSASRFMYRILRTAIQNYRHTSEQIKIMIIGAGEATNALMREIQNSRYLDNSKVVAIIDDDPKKIGKYIRGVKVVGTRHNIKEYARYYSIDEIIFAIPSASQDTKREILNICKETPCNLKIIPGMYQMMDGEININDIRNVDVTDLLGRDPISVDLESIMGYVSNKVVMVTGGGGSIGSELCRQLVKHNPKCLIIFDIYENNAYDIQQELEMDYPDANVVTLIGSVRNQSRLEDVFAIYKPDIVYHAAAHKHVPLMEISPNEAIKNNVCGTWNVAKMADKYKTKRFVMISTDKAVNPTNVMGATKRICEMIIQYYNEISETEFVAVRFGNVLGSNGSVIPLFKKQIEAGGPVTVTHPDIIRYFMTIPEAVSLVIQAGAYAKGGEIFILDMGDPVKIDDLAKNLIRLSGYTLGVNMEIKYTGLRPGEKLYEELLMDEEGLQDTANKLIHIGKPIEFDKEHFAERIEKLKDYAYSESEQDVRDYVKFMVPTYKPKN
ncbi:MAG: nucleoside-diphosphate sugar epimerase/dehydratase [Eubacteriales bacterium]|nr:nucleoside-diphosphate sugar epimerase/dehydratase [Eubacteriales bacterium]